MHVKQRCLSMIAVVGGSMIGLGAAQAHAAPSAIPPAPARYHGSATYYGEPASVGMLVSAHLPDNTVIAMAPVTLDEFSNPVYDITIGGDDPETPEIEGPSDGDTVRFRLHGVPTDQTEVFDPGEDRTISLTVTRIEICIGVFEDMDRDAAFDPGEPWLPGFVLAVDQFFRVFDYATDGSEPHCDTFPAIDTVVRVQSAPDGYVALDIRLSIARIDQGRGVFYVRFPYVRSEGAPPTVTGTPPATTVPATPTPTPSVFPGPTGVPPLPTATASATPTASATATHTDTAEATATDPATATITATDAPTTGASATSGPTETQMPTATATATATDPATATPTDTPSATATSPATATASATRELRSEIVVNSPADPGELGDGLLTLREAMRLATGRLSTGSLGAGEMAQVSGTPGAASSDVIRFDPVVFPREVPVSIRVLPPTAGPGPSPTPPPGDPVGTVRSSLPRLSTGDDVIDGTGHRVVLEASVGALEAGGTPLFDGLVIDSAGNAVRGLEIRGFKTAVALVGDATGNVLGGAAPGEGLTVANNIAGFVLRGAGVLRTFMYGNNIGVEADGATAAGNATYGVLVIDGARGNLIGGLGAGNVIGGNFLNGVALLGRGTRDNVVQSNFIGTSASGSQPASNGIGIVIGAGASGNLVGGGTEAAANIVSGNSAEGIWVHGEGTRFNLVQGNVIGAALNRMDPLGNGGDGVLVSDGAIGTFVGGTDPRTANHIRHNRTGIRVRGPLTLGNTIRRNVISGNAGKGIALEDGANDGIVAPTLEVIDRFRIRGVAEPNSTVDVFSDPADEGEFWEGTVEADINGFFRLDLPRGFRGPNVAAVASDDDGNSSEFSRAGDVPPTPTPTPDFSVATLWLPYVARGHILFSSLMIEPAEQTAEMGEIRTLEVHAADLHDLFGMQLAIAYDPSKLTVIDAAPAVPGVQIEQGDFPDPGSIFVAENMVDESAGRIYYSFTLVDADSVGGSGVVARFRVRARAPGRADLRFTEALVSDSTARRLPVRPRGATVFVQAPPMATPTLVATNTPVPTDTLTPTPTPRPTLTPVPTNTPVPTRTPRPTLTPSPVPTAEATDTPRPTATATATVTREPTQPPTETATRPPDNTATATATASVTATTTVTATVTATSTASATATSSVTSTATVTATSTVTGTVTGTATATSTGTATVEPSPTVRPTRTRPPTRTATPEATAPTHTPTIAPTASPTRPDPSPTRLPTGTPAPGASPTPDGCERPLLDGGFETGEGWVLRGGQPPRYTTAMAHGDHRSVVLGVMPDEPNRFAYSSLWQPVDVPADATRLTVAAWTFQEAQPGGGADRQLMLVYDRDPADNTDGARSPVAYVFAERSDAKAWQRRTKTLDVTEFRGRRLWLYSTVVNDGLGGRAWMFLDDVEMVFCP